MKIYEANSQFKMIITLLVIVLAVAFLQSKFNILSTIGISTNKTDTVTTSTVKITSNNKENVVNVEIADTEDKRKQGLMERTYLEENTGMLFVFDTSVQTGFWMKNTLIPLDLIFISEESKIIDIKEDFKQCTTTECEIYVPKEKYKYCLEVNSGYVSKNSIKVGDSVTITASGS